MNTFVNDEDRKKLRAMADSLLADAKTDKFGVDSARVVNRLLDTVDFFQQSNYILSRKNVELDTMLDKLSEIHISATDKFVALREYATKVERERDTALAALDNLKLEMLDEHDVDGLNNDFDIRWRTVGAQIDRLFARGNEQEEEINKLKAKLNKKAAPKKSPKQPSPKVQKPNPEKRTVKKLK